MLKPRDSFRGELSVTYSPLLAMRLIASPLPIVVPLLYRLSGPRLLEAQEQIVEPRQSMRVTPPLEMIQIMNCDITARRRNDPFCVELYETDRPLSSHLSSRHCMGDLVSKVERAQWVIRGFRVVADPTVRMVSVFPHSWFRMGWSIQLFFRFRPHCLQLGR